MRLLDEAVTAYRSALTVRTPGDLPGDWAITQNNLGNVLSVQGERTGGRERAFAYSIKLPLPLGPR